MEILIIIVFIVLCGILNWIFKDFTINQLKKIIFYSLLFTIIFLPIAFIGAIFTTDSPIYSPLFPISIFLMVDGIPLAFLVSSIFQYIKKATNL